jgi:hypothetical protein
VLKAPGTPIDVLETFSWTHAHLRDHRHLRQHRHHHWNWHCFPPIASRACWCGASHYLSHLRRLHCLRGKRSKHVSALLSPAPVPVENRRQLPSSRPVAVPINIHATPSPMPCERKKNERNHLTKHRMAMRRQHLLGTGQTLVLERMDGMVQDQRGVNILVIN